jgi:hypothetical protein
MFPGDTDKPMSSSSERTLCFPRHMDEIQPSVTMDPVSVLTYDCGPVVRVSEIYFGATEGFPSADMVLKSRRISTHCLD